MKLYIMSNYPGFWQCLNPKPTLLRVRSTHSTFRAFHCPWHLDRNPWSFFVVVKNKGTSAQGCHYIWANNIPVMIQVQEVMWHTYNNFHFIRPRAFIVTANLTAILPMMLHRQILNLLTYIQRRHILKSTSPSTSNKHWIHWISQRSYFGNCTGITCGLNTV